MTIVDLIADVKYINSLIGSTKPPRIEFAKRDWMSEYRDLAIKHLAQYGYNL